MERYLFRKLLLILLSIMIGPLYAGQSVKSLKNINYSLEEEIISNFPTVLSPLSDLIIIYSDSFDEKTKLELGQLNFPLVKNKYVDEQIDYFLNQKKEFFETSLKRAETYIQEMKEVFAGYGLPEELAYLPLVESGFKSHAVSYQGARGMWQFMPGTSRWMGMMINSWVDERYDPIISCHFAARYLKYLYEKFQDWNLALAAYNYGGLNVKRAMNRAKSDDFYQLLEKRALPFETRNYVPRFMATVYLIKNKEKYGINFEESKKDYVYYSLPFMCTISLFLKYSQIEKTRFYELNPGLRTEFIPKSEQKYQLRLPENSIALIEENLDALKEKSYDNYVFYTIKAGDSLSVIAEKYGVSQSVIKSINNIRNANQIWVGQRIYIPVISQSPGTYSSGSSDYFVYIVKAGETISHIAYKFGISADTIIKWNQINNPELIQVGQEIKLYRN